MAYISQSPASVHASYGSGWLAGIVATVRRWRIERRTYNELAALSDRELDDLGIDRAGLADVARRAAEGA